MASGLPGSIGSCLRAFAALAGAGLLAAQATEAARPVNGAHYYGFAGDEFGDVEHLTYLSAEVQVSGSGRRLSHRNGGSYVSWTADCRLDRRGYVSGRIRLAAPGRRQVRVRRDGTFSLARRQGPVRFRLRGRFVAPGYARIVYRAGRPPQRPRDPRRPGICRSGRQRAAVYMDGEPPFSGCQTQRAQTVARTATGRIFRQYQLTNQGDFFPHVYACLFDGGERITLGQDYDDEGVDAPRQAGPFAAYAGVGCGISGCTSSIEVHDLRDGRRISQMAPTSGAVSGPNRVVDLELKDDASVAWSATQSEWFTSAEPLREIWASDSLGRRMLDSGPGIDLTSLTLTDSTLTWINGGVQRSASLD